MDETTKLTSQMYMSHPMIIRKSTKTLNPRTTKWAVKNFNLITMKGQVMQDSLLDYCALGVVMPFFVMWE
jgi:hypothetical protein